MFICYFKHGYVVTNKNNNNYYKIKISIIAFIIV